MSGYFWKTSLLRLSSNDSPNPTLGRRPYNFPCEWTTFGRDTCIKDHIEREQAPLQSTFKRIVQAAFRAVIRNLRAEVLASRTFGVDLRTPIAMTTGLCPSIPYCLQVRKAKNRKTSRQLLISLLSFCPVDSTLPNSPWSSLENITISPVRTYVCAVPKSINRHTE